MNTLRQYIIQLQVLCLVVGVTSVSAEEITVAVASNFREAMTEIVAEFERQTPHKIQVSYGSSGKFYAQISYGAPFNAFFSADQDKPEKLMKQGLAIPGSQFTYALGALALWSVKPSIDHSLMTLLTTAKFNKLALANPKLAPYGVAAMEVIKRLDLSEQVAAKLVRGENISQTFQFVSSGNADLGFVALSQIFSAGKITTGSAWIVPRNLYSPIKQDVVLLPRGKTSIATQQLISFMHSNEVSTILASYGYQTGPVGEKL